jgi:tRNA nucleotidyltransferase (CCA-adding enzyme)
MGDTAAPAWEHFHHDADIGVRGVGHTLAEAFEQAALAMTAVILEPDAVVERKSIELELSATDNELLLTEWLNALIYEMATRRMLFGRFEVALQGHRLKGKAWGEDIDLARHQPAVEIKGATLTELRVWGDEEGLWHAQCVVDV